MGGQQQHEPMASHRLVQVHGVERRSVKSREPHVSHNDDLEGVGRIPEPVGANTQ